MAATPAATYEGNCKAILWGKMVRMHCLLAIYCLVVAWLLCTVYALWSIFNPFAVLNSFRILLYGFSLWNAGVVPVLVLRKWQLTTTRNPPRSIIATLSSPSHRWTLLTYMISSTAFTFVYTRLLADTAVGHSSDGHFLLFLRRLTVINERPIFFAHTFGSLAVIYGVLQLLVSRSTVRWQSQEISSLRPAENIFLRLVETLPAAFRLAVVHSLISPVLYLFMVRHLEIMAIVWLLPISLFLQSARYAAFNPPSIPLFIYQQSIPCIALVCLWEVSNILFDVYTARPLLPPTQKQVSNKLMFEGLRSKDPYFLHHAWLEFSVLARTSEPAKKALFEDLSPDFSTAFGPGIVNPKSGLWGAVARQALLFLGEDYARLKRRGKAPPPTPAPAPTTAPSLPSNSNPHVHQLKPLPATSALRPLPPPSSAETLFRSIAAIPPPPVVTKAATALVKTASQVEIVKKVEGDVAKARGAVDLWLSRARAIVGLSPPLPLSITADDVLPRRDLDVWIVDALSGCIASAPQLDKYGLTQYTTPQILEALVKYEMELEAFVTELREAAIKAQERRDREQQLSMIHPTRFVRAVWAFIGWKGLEEDVHMASMEATVDVLTAFKEAIGRILRAYGERISAFKFPTRIANKLQTFADHV